MLVKNTVLRIEHLKRIKERENMSVAYYQI